MISYAPFEEEKPIVVPKQVKVPGPIIKKESKIPAMEGTECNYVVLVFLIGIMYLLIIKSA